ncbi:unnamed protein product [Thlaspi arvense]|uniref:FKB95-like N-terminal Kelch domain-containing protein n=1 Tax=Thlaspi arvense TaxID=13288 RepID=A0AAU9SN62_THLAR|nr:unnamed protein product [Thlaspi arvense]
MDPYGLYVAVGSKIYVVGGEFYDGTERTWKASSIDCRSHTVQHIGIHKRRKFPTVGDIIDGKIYVIHSEGVMVLDTETQKWDPSMKKPDVELGKTYIDGSVVMGDKIYMRNYDNSFVYESKENKWESDQMLNSEEWRGACVVDDVIYYYNSYMKGLRAYDPKQRCWREVKGLEEFSNKMAGSWRSKAGSYAYDPKQRYWRVVKGLEELLSKTTGSSGSRTVRYGGKLALFFHKTPLREIWCAEIALERRQEGEIWGKVQWCNGVMFCLIMVMGDFVQMFSCYDLRKKLSFVEITFSTFRSLFFPISYRSDFGVGSLFDF